MNKLQGLKLKFDVKDNPELSEAIQLRLFELGGSRSDYTGVLYVTAHTLVCNNGTITTYSMRPSDSGLEMPLSTLDDLYHLPEQKPKTHIISIGGCEDMEFSDKSYKELQRFFRDKS